METKNNDIKEFEKSLKAVSFINELIKRINNDETISQTDIISELKKLRSIVGFNKNFIHNKGFIDSVNKTNDEIYEEHWEGLCSTYSQMYDRLSQTYNEKYIVPEYYLIQYLTEQRKGSIIDVIKLIDNNMFDESKATSFEKDIFDFLNASDNMKTPYLLKYLAKSEGVDIDKYDRIEIDWQESLMDDVYDEALDAFYTKYPYIKKYAEKHPKQLQLEPLKTRQRFTYLKPQPKKNYGRKI